jgi:hypothetical protein
MSVDAGIERGWLTPRRRWQLFGVVLNVLALVFMLARAWLPGAGFQAAAAVCYAVGLIKFTSESTVGLTQSQAESMSGETIVIGRRRWAIGLVVLGVELALGLGLPGSPNLFTLFLAVLTAGGLVAHFRTVVRLETDALVVVSTRGTKRYLWPEILETSWIGGTGLMDAWSGPVLRVRGGAWDEPGPNLPSRVASLLLFGRSANEEAARQLADSARRHGVPFTPGLLKLINTGQRRPRLPGE